MPDKRGRRDMAKDKVHHQPQSTQTGDANLKCLAKDVAKFHSYAAVVAPNTSADQVSSLSSAGSTPDPKKGRTEPTWLEMQENIVRLMSQKMDTNNAIITEKIDSSTKSLADLIKINAQSIQDLTVRCDDLFKDLEETQATVRAVQTVTVDHEQRIAHLEEKVNEMDRYSRRWNLRLYGLPEMEGEDVKKRFMELCHQVVPVSEFISPDRLTCRMRERGRGLASIHCMAWLRRGD